jgi:hypothetical protein
MAGLTIELYTRCRELFLRIDEFVSHASISAVFAIAELQPYQNGLPETNSKEARVSQVIDYVITKYTANKQPVIGLLLDALRSHYADEHPIAGELDDLRAELGAATGGERWTDVPYAVVAMTRAQAQQLPDPVVAMIGQLLPNADAIWAAYSDLRDSWSPFPEDPQGISEILLETIDELNAERAADDKMAPLRLRSFTDAFFASDINTRSETHLALGREGCILIVDPISLFHPEIVDALSKSELVSKEERVAIVILSPVTLSRLEMHRMVEQEIATHIPLSTGRYKRISDNLYEFGVADPMALKRRLYRILPEAAVIVERQRANPRRRMLFQERSDAQAQGIHNAVLGRLPTR